MAKRVQMSTSDYVVLAVTPALLIVMVSSLAWYLIACFYGGQHDVRLKIITFLFSMGSVLCCRIAVEEGKEYAMGYAFALGFAVFLAAQRFVQLGILLNLGLVVTIMWTAWKLTWDSTVIDDTEGSTGEGLLETIRQEQEDPPSDELEAVTGEERPAPAPELPLWKQWLNSNKRPHNPGRWIVYYAVGSVPLLALGNMVVPATGRGPAFRALALYVASALAVLLSTSFLGLRKYLRQRRLEMPLDMAAVWLGSGAVMIALMMAAALLLPRPGVQLAADRAWQFGGERLNQASNYAQGSDSADAQDGRGGKKQDNQAKNANSDGPNGKQSGGKQSGGKQSGGKQSGGKQSGGKQSGGKQSGGKQSGGKQSGGKQSGGKQSGSKQSGSKQSGSKQSGSKQSGSKQSGSKESVSKESGSKQSGGKGVEQKEPSERNQPSQETRAKQQSPSSRADSRGMDLAQKENDQNNASDNKKSRSASNNSSRSRWRSPLSRLPSLGMRAIYWIGLIVIVGYLLFRYRQEVEAALKQFVADLRKFWERLFGARAGAEASLDAESPAAAGKLVRRPTFRDYQNPFHGEQWRNETAESLVRYTFAAAEAWASDHQCTRGVEQTAHEFARQLAAHNPQLEQSAMVLAQLYNHAAYAPRELPSQNIQHLRNVWTALESTTISPPAPPTPPPPPAPPAMSSGS